MNKFEYIKAINNDQGITHAEFRLLVALWNYSDTDSLTAYPSIGMLVKASGFTRRAVLRYLASLQEKGYIETVKNGGPNTGSTIRKLVTPNHEVVAMSATTVVATSDTSGDERHHGDDDHYVVAMSTTRGSGDERHPNNQENNQRIINSGVANANAPAPVENPKQPKRGTRLPDHFKLDQATIDWTTKQPNPHKLNPNTEYEKFRDYWKAKPGKAGIKLDWNATWRNWWRKALEYAQQDNKHDHGYKNQHQLITEMYTTAISTDQTITDISPLASLERKTA